MSATTAPDWPTRIVQMTLIKQAVADVDTRKVWEQRMAGVAASDDQAAPRSQILAATDGLESNDNGCGRKHHYARDPVPHIQGLRVRCQWAATNSAIREIA